MTSIPLRDCPCVNVKALKHKCRCGSICYSEFPIASIEQSNLIVCIVSKSSFLAFGLPDFDPNIPRPAWWCKALVSIVARTPKRVRSLLSHDLLPGQDLNVTGNPGRKGGSSREISTEPVSWDIWWHLAEVPSATQQKQKPGAWTESIRTELNPGILKARAWIISKKMQKVKTDKNSIDMHRR